MKGPRPPSCPCIERVHISRRRLPVVGLILDRVADDDDVAGDKWPPRREVRCAHRVAHLDREIDLAAASELRVRLPRSCVHGNKIRVARADKQTFRGAVSPVGEPALQKPAVVRHASLVPLRIVDPACLAGFGVESGDQPEAGHGVHRAVHHERRLFVPAGAPQRIRHLDRAIRRLPSPRHLKILHVVPGDLTERRILRSGRVSEIVAPLALWTAPLRLAHEGMARSEEASDRERHPKTCQPRTFFTH